MDKKAIKCDVCAKGFSRKFSMIRHFKNFHSSNDGTHLRSCRDKKAFKCDVCAMGFTLKRNLMRHLKIFHPSVHPTSEIKRPKPKASHSCDVCKKAYCHFPNLLQHKKVVHGIQDYIPKMHLKCSECHWIFSSRRDFLEHFVTDHPHMKIENRIMHFENHNQFLKWKVFIEKKTASSYLLNCKYTTRKSVIHGYTCNRSGELKSRSRGIRRVKGSLKIGAFCPARLLYEVPLGQKNVIVKFTCTHVGHVTASTYNCPELDPSDNIEELCNSQTENQYRENSAPELPSTDVEQTISSICSNQELDPSDIEVLCNSQTENQYSENSAPELPSTDVEQTISSICSNQELDPSDNIEVLCNSQADNQYSENSATEFTSAHVGHTISSTYNCPELDPSDNSIVKCNSQNENQLKEISTTELPSSPDGDTIASTYDCPELASSDSCHSQTENQYRTQSITESEQQGVDPSSLKAEVERELLGCLADLETCNTSDQYKFILNSLKTLRSNIESLKTNKPSLPSVTQRYPSNKNIQQVFQVQKNIKEDKKEVPLPQKVYILSFNLEK